uniref:TPX2_importin domain-containing protein n=1 Tax=Caenorhabditis tropicalis TaxID=1561998 RepID=A0A1I7UUD7_9PELO
MLHTWALRCGSSCEREIDSLDPLRPSTNELSGARLLIRKAYKETATSSSQIIDIKEGIGSRMSARGRKGTGRDGRIGTATSQHTFVIETERRRPLMINIGLSDGALEYKKHRMRSQKERRRRESKEKEKEKVEKEKQKALRHIQLTSRKAPSLLRKELSESTTPLIEKFMGRKTNGSRLSLNKKPSLPEVRGSPPSEKNNNHNDFKGSNETIVLSSYFYTVETNSSPEDYTAVFGSRPKVARTPDTQSRSFF